MPVDGGLIVGYLTAALVRGGRRWADRRVDGLLDSLTDRVRRQLGQAPIAALGSHPHDDLLQRDVGIDIDNALIADRRFARDLAKIARGLDARGGRRMLNQVYAQTNVQAFDHGIAVGRDFNYFRVPDQTDLSGSPAWVKLCVVAGSMIALAAFGIFGYTLFTWNPDLNDPQFGQMPPGFGVAGAVFFAGLVILAVASLGRSLSRRR